MFNKFGVNYTGPTSPMEEKNKKYEIYEHNETPIETDGDKQIPWTAEKDKLFLDGFYSNQKEPPEILVIDKTKTNPRNPFNFNSMFNTKQQEQKTEQSSFEPYKPTKEEWGKTTEKSSNNIQKRSWLDTTSNILTAASFVPGVDTFTNLAAIPVDLLRGDYLSAALDLVGAIPVVGEIADASKSIKAVDNVFDLSKGIKIADKASDLSKTAKTASVGDLLQTHGLTLSKRDFVGLVDDIRKNGIKETIKYVEYNGKKYVVDGHHRLQAAKQIGLKDIPVEKVNLPYKGYKTIDDVLWFD